MARNSIVALVNPDWDKGLYYGLNLSRVNKLVYFSRSYSNSMFVIELDDNQNYSNISGVCEIPDNIYSNISEQSSIQGLGFTLGDNTCDDNGVPLEFTLSKQTNELLTFDLQEEIIKRRLIYVNPKAVKTKIIDEVEYKYVEVNGNIIVFKTVPDQIELFDKNVASHYPVAVEKGLYTTESTLRRVSERQFDPYIISTMTPQRFYLELKKKVDSELGKTLNSSAVYHTPYYYRYQLNKMSAQDKTTSIDITSQVNNLRLTRNSEAVLPSYEGVKPGALFVKSEGTSGEESYDNTVLKDFIDNVFKYIQDSIGTTATGDFVGITKETNTCHSSCFQ
ncbi:TPA: hypothetical protein SFZ43_000730 [Campylobacter jejuni]|nr:hypothetical protein [Campylobacter jejuni]